MLRWMMGIKKIRNEEEIRARVGLANTCEKIREERLRWLGHVDRETYEDVLMEVSGHRKIGIPKLRWSDVIRKDMRQGGKSTKDQRT